MTSSNGHIWRQASIKLFPCVIFCFIGIVICVKNGDGWSGSAEQKLIALSGVLLFVVASVFFLRIITHTIRIATARHIGAGRADAIEFMLRIIGYIVIVFLTLNVVNIPIERLLLGSAVLGIVLGVAAQQALANFFASIVLVISHPFSVGEDIILKSGALGGEYTGMVVDIGITHTKLQEQNGTIISLPNATVLSGAAISTKKHIQKNPSDTTTSNLKQNT